MSLSREDLTIEYSTLSQTVPTIGALARGLQILILSRNKRMNPNARQAKCVCHR